MVRYLDPEDHPESGEARREPRLSPAERLARLRERNAALTGTAAIEGAREVALRLLDSRSRSTGEIRSAIELKGFAPEVAEEVIERLARVGLVDDAAFARALVADRFRGSGKTGRALVEEMRRKGLDQATIEAAMESIEPEDVRERAAELVERKLRSMRGVPRDTAYRRLAGTLARKGYPPSLCSSLVAEALSAREGAEDGEGEAY